MLCLKCDSDNRADQRVCEQCGASLSPARVEEALARTAAELAGGHFEQAQATMTQVDTAMLALTEDERQQYLFTARAFALQGQIYFNRGLMDEAREEFQLARQRLEGRADGRGILAEVMGKLGNVSHLQNRAAEAISYYTRAAELAIEEQAAGIALKAYNNIGNIYISQGEVDEATEYYRRGLEQARHSDDPTALARSYRILATLHSNYGPYSKAVEYARQALAECERIPNSEARCLISSEAARVLARYGELAEAERHLFTAYEQIRHLGGKMAEAMVAINLVELIHQQSEPDDWLASASRVVMKALESAAISPLLRSETVRLLTRYYISQQDWSHAHRYLGQLKNAPSWGVELTWDDQAIIAHAQAALHAALQQWTEADSQFRTAIDLLSVHNLSYYELALTWEEYGQMLRCRDEAEAATNYQTSATEALRTAASLYRQLELPHRAAAVEALIDGHERTAPAKLDVDN